MNEPTSAERRRVMIIGVVMLLALIGGSIAVFQFARVSMQPNKPGSDAGGDIVSQLNEKENQFVGNAKCASCHAEISAQYAKSRKSRSLLEVAKAEVIEDYENGILPSQQYSFRMERDNDGNVSHTEYIVGAYEHKENIDYVLGSGKRERAYAAEDFGYLFQSPIVWNTAEADWTPVDLPQNPHFERKLTEDCLRCHAGPMHSAGPATNRLKQPLFTESAISCESCHGPGGKHVAKHESDPNAKRGGDRTILNPTKLGSRRADHLCASCHLQTHELIPHKGKTVLDFKAGMLLEQVYAALVATPKNDSEYLQASQPMQMRGSNCFIKSQGKLNCQSCHDPHGEPDAADVGGYYNAKCASCHESEDACGLPEEERMAAPANGSCISCHMPKIKNNIKIHSAITDHRIRRRATVNKEGPVKFTVAELAMYDDGNLRVEPEVNKRAMNLATLKSSIEAMDLNKARTAAKNIMPDTEKPMESIAQMKDDLPVVSAIGEMLKGANRREAAIGCWEQILQYYPQHEETLLAMTRASVAARDSKAILDYGKRWIEAQPRASAPRAFRAVALKMTGDTEAAIKEAEEALRLTPSSISLRLWLEGTYREAGKVDLAEQQLKAIQVLEAAGIQDDPTSLW